MIKVVSIVGLHFTHQLIVTRRLKRSTLTLKKVEAHVLMQLLDQGLV